MAVTTVNTAGYLGELFLTGKRPNAFLKLAGHFGGASIGEPFAYKQSTSREFPIGTFYSLPAPSQPAVLEGANAPAAGTTSLTQTTNVVQLFQETVSVSYLAESDKTISGVVPIPQGPENGPVVNPRSMEFQIMAKLEKIAQDANYTFLNGAFNNPADPSAAALKTRGIMTAVTTNLNDQSADATGMTTALYRGYINTTLQNMISHNGFAVDETYTLFAGVQEFANVCAAWEGLGSYFFGPEVNVAGVKLRRIVTRFGTINLVLDPDVPAQYLLIANMGMVGIVGLEVPGKGVLFEEPLLKQGSADQTQIYGQMGIDHAPEYYHGVLKVRAGVSL